MNYLLSCISLVLACSLTLSAGQGDSSANTRQYYSGKVGFYNPGGGLNNGFVVGIDGVTEFLRYSLVLTGAADLYPKQSIDIFSDPKPEVTSQQIILLPLHISAGYKVLDLPDADTRIYLGAGAGYYFYFYNATYRTSSGGLLGGSLGSREDAKNGGGMLGTLFGRLLINQIFIEPRLYFAGQSEGAFGGHTFTVDPSGFSITLGFQYH